ncbi:enoyl-CoA hydratase-related protein [Rhizobium mongolense]
MNTPVVKLARHEDVAVIEIDHKPVNALSKAVRQGLLDALFVIAADPCIRAVVIHGGQVCFIAGADIKELAGPLEAPFLPDVIAKIDALTIPVIAAIDGVALGGGLEIALACDRRIASPRSSLALPETRLGLIPGAGGTQRLPRLVGIEWAELIIATGEVLTAKQALGIGLVDVILDDPLQTAIAQAGATPKRRLSAAAVPQKREAGLSDRFLPFRQSEPAAVAAVALVRDTLALSFQDGLARERDRFLKLRDGSEARARIHLFLSGKAAFRHTGAVGKERRVASIAIAGSGKRAKAVAALLRPSGLSVSIGDSALSEADLIIDVADDRKAAISLRRLASLAKVDAVIATTRARSLDRLADVFGRSADSVGLHFRLSSRRSLVEVTPTMQTAPEVVNAVLGLIRRTGTQAVVTRRSGLVGERLLAACRASADDLRRSGVSYREVKTALFSCGLPQLQSLPASGKKSIDPTLRNRLIEDMAREGLALVSEGIVRRSFDIDLIMVHGYEFPYEDGGPMWASGILEDRDASTVAYDHTTTKVRV